MPNWPSPFIGAGAPMSLPVFSPEEIAEIGRISASAASSTMAARDVETATSQMRAAVDEANKGWSSRAIERVGVSLKGIGPAAIQMGVGMATGGSGTMGAIIGQIAGPGKIAQIVAAVLQSVVASERAKTDVMRGSIAAVYASQGYGIDLETGPDVGIIMPIFGTWGGTVGGKIGGILGIPGARKIYIRESDRIGGTFSGAKAFVSSMLEGAGMDRSWQDAQQTFWEKQTFKHPDVIQRARGIGNRFEEQVRRGGTPFAGNKETSTYGG